MQIQKTDFKGLLVLQPNKYTDNRGSFYESWNKEVFKKIGLDIDFVQDNQSYSHKHVLRGLHFQNPPNAQGKLVRVTRGIALDVVVDLRKKSSTFGKYFKIELSSEKSNMLWIPSGFAHGFIALDNDTIFQYKCDSPYKPESEECLLWNDETLDINWGIKNPIVSSKDQQGELFKMFNSPF